MTATREESEAIRAERARRHRYNNPRPTPTIATKTCVWYGTTPTGDYRSDVIEHGDVATFVDTCHRDGWPAVAVYEDVMPIAGLRNGHMWINELEVAS